VDGHAFTHLLAALVLLSRLGDVISTRLVTPRDAAGPANSHHQPT